MTLRLIIEGAAEEVCNFNRKLTFGRLGPQGLASSTLEEDIANQAVLVAEEVNEFREARSVVALLDGAIDMLVTEVWQVVLEGAYHINDVSVEEAIEKTLAGYEAQGVNLRCVTPLLFLSRLGVDVAGAISAVLVDNRTKFITDVKECAYTVSHYRDVLGVECEARPVDHFKREWAVFRLPDLKMLKPYAYMQKASRGEGLSLTQYIPKPYRNVYVSPEDTVIGPEDSYLDSGELV